MQGAPVLGTLSLENEDEAEVSYLFWLNMRLALGPVNDPDTIGPLLEFLSTLEAHLHDGQIARFDYPVIDEVEPPDFAYINGESRRVTGIELTSPAKAPPAMFREDAYHSYIGRREISLALLRTLFAEDHTACLEHELGDATPEHRSATTIRFRRTSTIGAINEALLKGQLEAKLGAECDRLSAGLDTLRAEQEKKIRAAEAEALARWASQVTNIPLTIGEQQ